MAVLLGSACVRLNADHCANQVDPAAYCGARHGVGFCSACVGAADGCVAERPSPACAAGDSTSSGAQSDTTTTTTATTVATGDASSESGADSTTLISSSDESGSTGEPPEPFCGDGIVQVELGETCDGVDMPATMCSQVLLGGGVLGCHPPGTNLQCKYDTGDCDDSAQCDDGMIEGAETCETDDLAGETCETLDGFIGGKLTCDPVQCVYDTEQCTPCMPPGGACTTRDDCCNSQLLGCGALSGECGGL